MTEPDQDADGLEVNRPGVNGPGSNGLEADGRDVNGRDASSRSDGGQPDVHQPESLPGSRGDEGQDEGQEERRYPSTIGGAIYLGVLALAVAGVVIAATGHWRAGVRCLAAGLVVAAIMRLLLPARDAGMLAVRNRIFDAALAGSVGIALWVLAWTLPAL